MSFKDSYNKGNRFIFSPIGEISRGIYFLYALTLDLFYRLFLALGQIVSDKEASEILYLIGSFIIVIIVLKFFNYKKRFQNILKNTKISYLLSLVYMLIGAYLHEYLYLLKLQNKAVLYELTASTPEYHGIIKNFSNVYLSSFIGSQTADIIFNILTTIGIIIFLTLIFVPEKKYKN